MSDPVIEFLKSLGAEQSQVNSIPKRTRFICDYWGFEPISVSDSVHRKMWKEVRKQLKNGKKITKENFPMYACKAIEPPMKWDLDHIAFARSKGFYRSQRWRNLRYKVLADINTCECCGRDPRTHGVVLHVDHILPRSIYPEYALNRINLQVLCEDCNMGKGNTDSTEFKKKKNRLFRRLSKAEYYDDDYLEKS